MPPNATDTFIILKPRDGVARSGPAQGRADPRDRRAEAAKLPGNKLRVHPADPDALQRAARRRARGRRGQGLRRRVRADAARRQPDRRRCSTAFAAPTDVKVEQVTRACRCSTSRSTRPRSRATASTCPTVQDVIGTAVGGRAAGLVFEGDRRFEIVVRLSDVDAQRPRRAQEPAGAAAAERRRRRRGCRLTRPAARARRLQPLRRAEPDQPRERQAPRRRDGQRARARHRLGRRGGAGEDRASR